MTDSVLYEVEPSGVCTITMNMPERRNAFDDEMLAGIAAAFDRARDDDDVAVVVFTGAGKAFCAGGDVKEMGSATDPVAQKSAFTNHIHLVPNAITRCDKPIIAMMNGAAVGAGFDMAMFCDLRIASETAKFSEGYVNVGLVAGDGGAFLLPRIIGVAKTLELLLTGRVFTGKEAAELGLVNEAVPADDLRRVTYELAEELASKPRYATRMMKRLVYESLQVPYATAMELASSQVAILLCGDEHRDTVAAFRARQERKGA